ncbi:MAG: class I SAM-dependent methyltransferase [Verrucomicrobia bacterium]|nr:class I SAM-dependent methyltransferase [Verrucomicrobiota bacterium]
MATVEWNLKQWCLYDWDYRGDEWSAGWGSVEMQWYGSILPRIQRLLPVEAILEIAPGFGRWTQFLKEHCQSLIAVDLSEKCIEGCRERFREHEHLKFYVNDGKSLAMVPDNSVDLVFSFDSLVHADPSVMKAYISQFPRILTRNGVAFLHHSNYGSYPIYQKIRGVRILGAALAHLGILVLNQGWRDGKMTADQLVLFAEEQGLKCMSQELINWGARGVLNDCLSVIVRSNSPLARSNRVLRNNSFGSEVRYLRKLAPLYTKQLDRKPDIKVS